MKRVAFIGIGVMGRSMAGHLMDAGYELHIYTRTREKALPLIDRGAVFHETSGECARAAEAVITMVGFPQDVEQVYFGEHGILSEALPGTLLIDMTTTDPALSERIYAAAREKGMSALDAPVSGGDVGAKNATLTIMAGGDKEAFDRAKELFEKMGKAVTYTGPAGSGQHTKVCNQIAVVGALAGATEALVYARKAGLDPENMLACISGGAAASWQLSNMIPRVLAGNYAPGFFIKHQVKDLRIADAQAKALGAELPVTEIIKAMYEGLEADGYGDNGTQALVKHYEKE